MTNLSETQVRPKAHVAEAIVNHISGANKGRCRRHLQWGPLVDAAVPERVHWLKFDVWPNLVVMDALRALDISQWCSEIDRLNHRRLSTEPRINGSRCYVGV